MVRPLRIGKTAPTRVSQYLSKSHCVSGNIKMENKDAEQ